MTPEEQLTFLKLQVTDLKNQVKEARAARDEAIIENAQLKNKLNAYSTVLNEIRVQLSELGDGYNQYEFAPWLRTKLSEVGIKEIE